MKPILDKIKSFLNTMKKSNSVQEDKEILLGQFAMSVSTIDKIEKLVVQDNLSKDEIKSEILKLITVNYNFMLTGKYSEEETEKTEYVRNEVKKSLK